MMPPFQPPAVTARASDAAPTGPLMATKDSSDAFQDRIREVVESTLGISVPDDHANLIGLGVNSMEMVRIINRLDDDLGFRPPFEELSANPTIAALAAAMRASVAGAGSPGPLAAMPTAAADTSRTAVPALRHDAQFPKIELRRTAAQDALRSTRSFGPAPLTLQGLDQLLAGLATPGAAGGHALYAAAGGRYAVQCYVQVAAGAHDVPCGLYYHHPQRQELWLLAPDLGPEPELFEPVINAPMARRASFVVYLVWRPAALVPDYGARARDYALIEAGAMAQVLRASAPACGLGLCPIGEMNFAPVRGWFELDDDQECLHALFGGPLA
jgi:SagB-type dehydrogenase family enzyme